MGAKKNKQTSQLSPSDKSKETQYISVWLAACAVFVGVMVVVGGLTRMTESGLSITEWRVISGIFPPLDEAAWQEAFRKYQQIPEYRYQNAGMSLASFKVIYWWEWTHRLLGRLLGVFFLLPFLWFLFRGSISRARCGSYLLLFFLGAAQGVLGWFMVASGLQDRVDVSHFRLAAHLSLALFLYAALWRASLLMHWPLAGKGLRGKALPCLKKERIGIGLLIVLFFVQSALGGLVAGLRAGRLYTDWPLMAGRIVPSDYNWDVLWTAAGPVQFHHRLGAYVLLVFGIWLAWHIREKARIWPQPWRARLRFAALAMASCLLGQGVLGVVTLMTGAPLFWGVLHQTGALFLLYFLLRVQILLSVDPEESAGLDATGARV